MLYINEKEVAYQPGATIADLVLGYYPHVPKVDYETYIVVLNGVAITSAQAEATSLQDDDRLHIVPKVDGG